MGLASAKIKFESVTYDSSADSITVNVKKAFLKIAIKLTKNAEMEVTYNYRYDAPRGTYKGSKKVLGLSIDTSLTFDDSSHFDLLISGAASVDCKQESYTYDGSSSISLPVEGNSGDCLHDAMASAGIKLESISYDSAADTVTVKVEKIIGISITLSK